MIQAVKDFIDAGGDPIWEVFYGIFFLIAGIIAIEFINWLWRERP
jgi:hypothetical protein